MMKYTTATLLILALVYRQRKNLTLALKISLRFKQLLRSLDSFIQL